MENNEVNNTNELYYCPSIVNGKKVYRVWKKGQLIGEFDTAKGAVDLVKKHTDKVRFQDIFSEEIETVLVKMFEFIGKTKKDYDSFNFDNPFWFTKNTWSDASQESFIRWLTKHIYNNGKLRRELNKTTQRTKKGCEGLAKSFAFNYGWKIENK
jgi:hypothetical protein